VSPPEFAPPELGLPALPALPPVAVVGSESAAELQEATMKSVSGSANKSGRT